jgi:5'-deoxynucleotidase YfbR-like HD superfamily hydrolase
MNIETFNKDQILTDLAKLQYLYGLKKVIRYDQNRHETDSTESVAEHVYGMHILAQYFLPLENPKGSWDKSRIYEMITLHDIDEIETGDVLGYTKTEEIRALEIESKNLPNILKKP